MNKVDKVKYIIELEEQKAQLERKLTVRAHVFSETAKEKIETAGGKAEVM